MGLYIEVVDEIFSLSIMTDCRITSRSMAEITEISPETYESGALDELFRRNLVEEALLDSCDLDLDFDGRCLHLTIVDRDADL